MKKSSAKYLIRKLPTEERPRERLLRFGPEAISTAELIAIIWGSGTKEVSVLELAQEVLMRFGTLERLSQGSVEEFCQIKGVGLAKALQLKASFNLGMRASRPFVEPKWQIVQPLHVYYLVKDQLEKEKRELFLVVLRDTKGKLICQETVAIGTLSETLIHPREIFYPAIRHKAHSLVLVHNHPSGDPTPSKEDIELTKRLIEVGELLQVPVLDHLIIGKGNFLSMRHEGKIFSTN